MATAAIPPHSYNCVDDSWPFRGASSVSKILFQGSVAAGSSTAALLADISLCFLPPPSHSLWACVGPCVVIVLCGGDLCRLEFFFSSIFQYFAQGRVLDLLLLLFGAVGISAVWIFFSQVFFSILWVLIVRV
ncbi:unnamed protein product [Ectocarpus sp. 8 AP-2014]